MQYKIIVDKQPRTNPSNEKKEYTINIEELRRKGIVYDSLNITLDKTYVTRRLMLSEYGVLNELSQPKIEELNEINVELFAGDNYIYLSDMTGNHFYAEYIVKNDFTDTYVTASQAIIVKADNTDITSSADVEGKVIGVQLGTTGDLFASDVTETVERYNKGFEAVQALAQGKIDAVMIDDQVAKALAADNADVKVLDEPFTTEEYAIAVKKGNTELVDSINAALTELKQSGQLQEIVDKYITAE